MRIVGGIWRQRSFEAPSGRSTRPTTDRMREAIASMVLSAAGLDLDGIAVLDAFAGSGAVGLELLSRGAASCTFCERDRKTAALIRANCESLGVDAGMWRVACGDVMRLAPRGLWGAPFGIVFLDPPYAVCADDVSALVLSLLQTGQLAPGCLLVYERSAKGAKIDVPGAQELRSRVMSSSCVDLLRLEG